MLVDDLHCRRGPDAKARDNAVFAIGPSRSVCNDGVRSGDFTGCVVPAAKTATIQVAVRASERRNALTSYPLV